jgi:hypothetical protein
MPMEPLIRKGSADSGSARLDMEGEARINKEGRRIQAKASEDDCKNTT